MLVAKHDIVKFVGSEKFIRVGSGEKMSSFNVRPGDIGIVMSEAETSDGTDVYLKILFPQNLQRIYIKIHELQEI